MCIRDRQERLPGLPEIAPAELASLRTLRDVADKLSTGLPAGAPAAAAPVAQPAPTQPAAATSGASAVDVTALALEVVAEKTGYPVEMLDLDMEMEAGLGIDSIKQVEILSELQERLPGLPEIAPAELASLRTLRDVADKLSGNAAPPDVVRASAPVSVSPVETAAMEATASPDVVLDTNTVLDPTKITAFVPVVATEQRPGFALSALSKGRQVLITNENPALAEALVAGLVARGLSATVVDELPVSASAVICLAGMAGVSAGPDLSLIHISEPTRPY